MLIIENPITGEKIQVANQDFAHKMTWKRAAEECRNLGPGWRLPTVEKFKVIYKEIHLKGEGNFKDEFYWTSTKQKIDEIYYSFSISSGEEDPFPGSIYEFENHQDLLRAVKSI